MGLCRIQRASYSRRSHSLGDMRVNLRGAHIRVAQQFLNGAAEGRVEAA